MIAADEAEGDGVRIFPCGFEQFLRCLNVEGLSGLLLSFGTIQKDHDLSEQFGPCTCHDCLQHFLEQRGDGELNLYAYK